MRVKKHVDKDADADAGTSAQYDITDNFLSMAGCHMVEKITMSMAPEKPEDSKFDKIEEVLLRYIEPEEQLTISERSNFFSTLQTIGQSISDFVVSLQTAARYCKFEELKQCEDPIEEMIKMQFISGLYSAEKKLKLLEYLQTKTVASI